MRRICMSRIDIGCGVTVATSKSEYSMCGVTNLPLYYDNIMQPILSHCHNHITNNCDCDYKHEYYSNMVQDYAIIK